MKSSAAAPFTTHVMGYPVAPPTHQLQQPPLLQLAAVIPIQLRNTGTELAFPSSYSIALQGRLSREEYNSMIAELNAAVKMHSPMMSTGATVALRIPLVSSFYGRYHAYDSKGKMTSLLEQLEHSCQALNKAILGCRGMNLRVTHTSGLPIYTTRLTRSQRRGDRQKEVIRVDLEVLA